MWELFLQVYSPTWIIIIIYLVCSLPLSFSIFLLIAGVFRTLNKKIKVIPLILMPMPVQSKSQWWKTFYWNRSHLCSCVLVWERKRAKVCAHRNRCVMQCWSAGCTPSSLSSNFVEKAIDGERCGDEIVCMVQNDLKTNLLKTFKCGAL